MAPALLPLLLAALTAAAPAAAAAPHAAPPVVVTPEGRDWQPFGLVHRVPLRGDLLERACPSATLVRLRPGTRLPPHSAPASRTFVVLSGTLHVGVGPSWEEARLQALPSGSFWVVPAGTSTFEEAEGEVVAEVVVGRPGADCPEPDQPRFLTPTAIRWQPAGALERAVLNGDPAAAECPSAVRWRLPAGGTVPGPAGQAAGETLDTVLSGEVRAGEALAPARAGAAAGLPAGSTLVLPRGAPAAIEAVAGAVVQVDYLGPSHPACEWLEFVRSRAAR
jgi:quercetin dioxygenase-like cupin family protein